MAEPSVRGAAGRRSLALLVVATAAAALTACGGSGSPHVASLGTNASTRSGTSSPGSGRSTTTVASGNATQLLNGWASCMQRHGDSNQADPTIDANKVIHLTWDDAIPGGIYGTNKGGQGNAGPGQYCRTYIDEAETDLQGAQHLRQPTQVQLVRFSRCMRANGVPDFPDPSNGRLVFNVAGGGDLSPGNPVFQTGSTLCAKKVGVPRFAAGGSPQPGSVEFNGDAPDGAGG